MLSVNEEGHNCLNISNISSHIKVNKLLDQEFFHHWFYSVMI